MSKFMSDMYRSAEFKGLKNVKISNPFSRKDEKKRAPMTYDETEKRYGYAGGLAGLAGGAVAGGLGANATHSILKNDFINNRARNINTTREGRKLIKTMLRNKGLMVASGALTSGALLGLGGRAIGGTVGKLRNLTRDARKQNTPYDEERIRKARKGMLYGAAGGALLGGAGLGAVAGRYGGLKAGLAGAGIGALGTALTGGVLGQSIATRRQRKAQQRKLQQEYVTKNSRYK